MTAVDVETAGQPRSRPASPLLVAITWLELFLVASLGFVAVAWVWLFTFAFDRKRVLTGRTLRLVAVAAAKFCPLWRFRIHGPLPAHTPTRTVCVSNHCSYTDVFLIAHVPWEMKWLAKRSLFNMPFIGWGMRLAKDVAIERASPQSAKAALARCAEWLQQGIPVMIFPEGTRSSDGQMQPFKDGAFRLAIEAQADVLPMAVAGTSSALPKEGFRPGFSHGLLSIGEPISTAGMTLSDLPALKEQARTRIAALREGLLPLI